MLFKMFIVGLLLCLSDAAFAQNRPSDWPMFGQNPANTAANPTETIISPNNANQLQTKWAFTTTGDVSARATVVNGVAYFPDWGPILNQSNPAVTGTSTLWAVNTSNGTYLWSRLLSDYGLPVNTHSRTSPAVVNNTLYLGTQEGAWLLAINAATGGLIWKTQLESPANDFFAIISTSPTVVGGVVYTGVASLEEAAVAFGAPCCSSRGSVVAVNALTGKIKWQTYTVPQGYSGGGVWGSNPVVDGNTNTLFIGTGNNYHHPKPEAESSIPGVSYETCISRGGAAASCNSPRNYVDAILALDTGNGKVKWDRKLVNWNQPGVIDGSDDWNVGCLFGTASCPSNAGPDYDFGSAPNLITYQTSKGPKTILGAGQKSGIYFALDPKTGATLWQTQVGPGSALGGMEWGSASDGKRIYVQIANLYGIPYLDDSLGSAGTWAALDPATGAILWQKKDPNGAMALGPMTVANGVVYAGSMAGPATAQTMFALNAATGVKLWSFAAGSSVNAGATVVNGAVFWGSGYTHLGIPGMTGNNKFYAFSLNGN